jgi:RNA exonuclease 4
MSASNKGMILTKKQQRLLKERRRKKKLAADGVGKSKDDEVVADSSYDQLQPLQQETEQGDPTKKVTEETNTTKTGAKRKRQSDTAATTAATTATTATTFYIPDDIYDNAKAAKKFRKDARRDAKSSGASDAAVAKLKFVKESDRPTRKFPVLKELVKEQQEKKKQLAEGVGQDQQDVDEELPASATTTTTNVDTSQYVALDCEMVGIGTDGKKSVLARASLVDWHGHCIYDRYVQVPVHVTDFRTKFSGIKPAHLKDKKHGAVSPTECRKDIAALLKSKILVGHALHNDLDVLLLQHADVRDTAKYRPFQRLTYAGQYRPRKLKDLVAEHLQQTIQVGSHDSVQDAAAAMALYQVVHVEWEREITLQLAKKSQSNSHRRGSKKK